MIIKVSVGFTGNTVTFPWRTEVQAIVNTDNEVVFNSVPFKFSHRYDVLVQ